jgi:lysophospholipase L1-like esterase
MSSAPPATRPAAATKSRWRRAGIALSFALNALVLGAVAWLLLGGGGRVVAERWLRPHREQLESQFGEFPLASGDVVFLGDSITEGGRWEEIFPSAPARNRGIGGDTSAGVLARLAQVTSAKPSAVFLMIGTNDLTTGASVEEISANVEAILARIRDESPSTRVLVQSVLPRGADYRSRVERLNARLAEIARDAGVEFVDLYPKFLDPSDGSIRNDLSNDELHLLGAGYRVWQTQLARYVPSAGIQKERP